MVESEAQGRLPGMQPVSVVDIGSNSVRLVVYEGLNRTPAILFNEKILCGLGKGIATTGLLDTEAVHRALSAVRRFRVLSEQARATDIHVIATAAAREAANGPDFIAEAEIMLGHPVRVLSGREEAYFSALGVISSFIEPDGIVGDFGGGSLELVDINGSEIGDGITLPIGGLRLSEESGQDTDEAKHIVRDKLGAAKLLRRSKHRTFYAVGGTWRNLAKLHMEISDYPLHMTQGYEIEADEAIEFLQAVEKGDTDKANISRAVSRNRRSLLPYGAITLVEILKTMKADRVSFSGLGVREGFLYSLLSEEQQALDPLLCAADELAILRARSPEYAREMADWTGVAFRAFGIEETLEESRYRRAACLLADISWRAHPDYRGAQSLNLIANGTYGGITHAGRAYIALANYYRFEGLRGDSLSEEMAALATPRLQEFAKVLGALFRVSYLFSASMPGVTPSLRFEPQDDGSIVLNIPSRLRSFAGERLEIRLQQLARTIDTSMHFNIET